MAVIKVETTDEERNAVFAVIERLDGSVLAVSTIAKQAGIPVSRARYAVVDLVDTGKITREAAKSFNKHYIRYRYSIVR